MLAAFLAIAWKEFLHIWRNVGALKIHLLLQCLDFCVIGFIDVTARDIPTVIVDQDQSVESRALISRVASTGSFAPRYATSSVDQARDHLRAGRARVALVIPPDYHRKRHAGDTARVLMLVDGSESHVSRRAVATLEGVVERLNFDSVHHQAGEERSALVSSESLLLFNPTGRTSLFMLPALLGIVLLGFLHMATRSLLRETQSGSMERLLMTPMDFTGLVAGKLAPYVIFGIANAAGYLLVMRWIFSVPIRGSLLLLLISISLYVSALLTLGMLIAALAPTDGMAALLRAIVVMTSFIVSGYLFPVESLPRLLQVYSYALPTTHIVSIMRALTLREAGVLDIAPDLAYLAIAPFVFLTLAARRLAAKVLKS